MKSRENQKNRRRLGGLLVMCAVIAPAIVAGLASCASGGSQPQAASNSGSAEESATSGSAPVGLRDTNRVLRNGDLMRIDVALPDRKYGAMEPIQSNGDVATPDGSFIKAGGLTLGQFLGDLSNLYRNVPGYEGVQVNAYVSSSPYKVVKYNPNRDPNSGTLYRDVAEQKKKKSWDTDFWADFDNQKNKPAETPAASATNAVRKIPAATLYPRNFQSPLTIWQAIQKEGGIPEDVNPKMIRVLHQDLERKTLDCSGPGGAPDGTNFVVTGDCIFLIPPGTPLSGIFE